MPSPCKDRGDQSKAGVVDMKGWAGQIETEMCIWGKVTEICRLEGKRGTWDNAAVSGLAEQVGSDVL